MTNSEDTERIQCPTCPGETTNGYAMGDKSKGYPCDDCMARFMEESDAMERPWLDDPDCIGTPTVSDYEMWSMLKATRGYRVTREELRARDWSKWE